MFGSVNNVQTSWISINLFENSEAVKYGVISIKISNLENLKY